MTAVFFSSASEFREWLEDNHAHEKELLVGYYKISSGKPNMTWSQSVDEALCFGWIDGVRKSIDATSYCIRFTPRKSTSTWSSINIEKVHELIRQGRMNPEGLAAFNQRDSKKPLAYSFENDTKELPDSFLQIFQSNKEAWDFFTKQAPSYRKASIHWIRSAKQETTQLARLDKIIDASLHQQRLGDNYKLKK